MRYFLLFSLLAIPSLSVTRGDCTNVDTDPSCFDGRCIKKTCTTSQDDAGNTIAKTTVDSSDACTEDCSATILTCDNYGTDPELAADGTDNCVCSCQRGVETCVSFTDIAAAIAANPDTSTKSLFDFRTACGASNPVLLEYGCGSLAFPDTLDTCSGSCPICDQTTECTAVNRKSTFCRSGQCAKFKCTTNTDEFGNIIATTEVTNTDDAGAALTCTDDCGSTTTTECAYDVKPALVDDATNCACSCERDGTENCIALADIKTDIVANAAELTANLVDFKTACGADNPLLLTYGCKEYLSFPADTTSTTCSATCPICDKTALCEEMDGTSVCKNGVCKLVACTTTTDENGNILPEFSYTTSDTCDPVCATDECDTEGVFADDAMCWFRCVLGSDGIRRKKLYSRIRYLLGSYDGLKELKRLCQARNSELADCYATDIVPVEFSDATPGCGCGVRRELCSYDTVYLKSRAAADDGTVTYTCTKKTCTLTTVEKTDAETGQVYENVKREEVSTVVDVSECGMTRTQTRSTPSPVDSTACSRTDLCEGARGESVVCVTNAAGRTYTTCKEAVACLNLDEAEYSVTDGRCVSSEVTEDECVAGTVSVTEDWVARSRCAKICKCVENADGITVEVCGRIEDKAGFRVFKALCPDQLGECEFGNLRFRQCPLSTDTDDEICDKLFCAEADADVCMAATEGFEDASIVPRDATTGCKFCECADDGSNTRVCKRYDVDTSTSEGILRQCKRLADCSNTVQYDERGVCGVCPVCSSDGVDNDCDSDTIRSGDAACREDSQEDDTRAEGETIEGRVKLVIGARACVDQFLDRTQSDCYAIIKRAALKVVKDECSVDLLKLRAHIAAFEFTFAEAVNNEDCDMVASVKAVLHFSDVNLDRLRALKECLLGIQDDIPVKIRTALVYATKGTRLEATSDADTTDTTADTEGDTFYAEAGVDTEIELLDAGGLNTIPDEIATTGAGGEDATTQQGEHGPGAGAAGWSVMGAIIASYIALLF